MPQISYYEKRNYQEMYKDGESEKTDLPHRESLNLI